MLGMILRWLLKFNSVYREDFDHTKYYATGKEKNNFYVQMKSGAESGWDFSSRWFITANGSNEGEYL